VSILAGTMVKFMRSEVAVIFRSYGSVNSARSIGAIVDSKKSERHEAIGKASWMNGRRLVRFTGLGPTTNTRLNIDGIKSLINVSA
jgi:hypothetical protein